jgi:hypothetical protein
MTPGPSPEAIRRSRLATWADDEGGTRLAIWAPGLFNGKRRPLRWQHERSGAYEVASGNRYLPTLAHDSLLRLAGFELERITSVEPRGQGV